VRWLLLVYTVPAQPTRKRAFIWRLLKKLGAVYLRDGICVLPDRPGTRAGLSAVADKIGEFGGQATLATEAQLDPATIEVVRRQAQQARRAEYTAVVDAGSALVSHIRRETRHRDLGPPELELLENDLVKLRRWCDQIRARDYFSAEGRTETEDVLAECWAALESPDANRRPLAATAR
jgi:hypothetical protein